MLPQQDELEGRMVSFLSFKTILERKKPMLHLLADSQQRFAVYHARDPWAMLFPAEDGWLSDPALHFRYVAEVQAEQLEQVFALTNHQETSWTRHPAIIWHATDGPVRSTSVGDVIVNTQTGQAWLVMPSGFRAMFTSPASHQTQTA